MALIEDTRDLEHRPRIGRPTNAPLDDPEVVDRLCDAIASGRGIKEVCGDPGMPSANAVWLKMAHDAAFCARVSRAREAQQDHEAERVVELADEATEDDWQVKRLQIQARQWRAARLAPKKYGDQLALTGANGGPIEVARVDDGELARMVALLLAQAGPGPMIEAHGSDAQVIDIAAEETDNSTESG